MKAITRPNHRLRETTSWLPHHSLAAPVRRFVLYLQFEATYFNSHALRLVLRFGLRHGAGASPAER